jgi:peptide/nickel transport system permease protein
VNTLRFVARRAAQSVPLLLLISLLVFALIHAAPGGPLSLYLDNPNVRPEDIERLRHALGLDRSLPAQYVAWLASFVRASVSRGFARVSTVSAVAGISLPVFWFGLVLQLVFAHALGWFPSSGRASFGANGLSDRLAHLVLPATVLAAVHAAAWSRYLHGSLQETLGRPFIPAARARGISEPAVLLRHALPNALAPFVTVVLLDASIMVSGAVVTESVFAWPGVGSLFTEALAKRDYTVLMAFLMCGSLAVMVLNLVADLVVRALDPRVRERA